MLKKSIDDQLDLESIDWVTVSQKMDGRNAKQCRDRWHNYLRPGIIKGHWTKHEEEFIKDMHKALGAKYVSRHYKRRIK
jgi:Myb-like DNA-binding domain